jgi:F-type H+-transporting ATPase subunit b
MSTGVGEAIEGFLFPQALAQETDTHAATVDGAGHVAEEVDHAEGGEAVELILLAALVVLLALLIWKGRAAILNMLDSRIERVRTDLAEAKTLRAEAEAAAAAAAKREQEAAAQAQAIIASAHGEAERLRTKALADLEAALVRREAMAMSHIAQAEAAAVAEVRSIAAEVAVGAARQLVEGQLAQDPARGHALLDAAIAELPAKLH